MTEIILRAVIVGLCAGLVFAYVCRLNLMTPRTARAVFIVFHAAMLLFCAWQGIDAFTRCALTQERIGLLAAAAWIGMSWHTWRHGMPAHVRRGSLKFPRLDL